MHGPSEHLRRISEPQPGILSRLLRSVFRPSLDREREFYRRLRELSAAIDEAPDSITHVVLRGELYLERGEYQRAKADFERALALAENFDAAEGWLIVEQVMRDRALSGISMLEGRTTSGV